MSKFLVLWGDANVPEVRLHAKCRNLRVRHLSDTRTKLLTESKPVSSCTLLQVSHCRLPPVLAAAPCSVFSIRQWDCCCRWLAPVSLVNQNETFLRGAGAWLQQETAAGSSQLSPWGCRGCRSRLARLRHARDWRSPSRHVQLREAVCAASPFIHRARRMRRQVNAQAWRIIGCTELSALSVQKQHEKHGGKRFGKVNDAMTYNPKPEMELGSTK